MKMKKVWALLVSLLLVASMALPVALAVSDDQGASAAAVSSEEGTPPAEEQVEQKEADPKPDAEPKQDDQESDSQEQDGKESGENQCTCGAAEGEAHEKGCPLYGAETAKDNQKLYDQLMAAKTMKQVNALLSGLSEAELTAFEGWVAEQQKTTELQNHVRSLEAQNTVAKTKAFTDAGPFMPAVTVDSMAKNIRRAARSLKENGADNGMNLSKAVKDNRDGTYTITLESYTTGKVTTTTKTIPVDIVLVLDQSGSMAYDFNGDSTNTNKARRQYAMKNAVNNFISAVNKKYSPEADHRIALVTFGSNASTLQDWTTVDNVGKTDLQGKVNGLPDTPSGATNAGAGMATAESLMGSSYNYTGTNTTRQKVVVLFTDGVPTTSSDFDTGVADSAIKSAKHLKDAGVTVYSVGIFNGANPDEMYGASGFDTNSNGTVGSKWIEEKRGLFPGTDFPEADRPAGNRFMNLVSSNYASASGIGLKRSTDGLGILRYEITYEITQNFNRTAGNYYLTADDAISLNNIFKTISDQISTPTINLGSEAVVKDIISDYFELPDGATAKDIQVYTADATATALENPTDASAWEDRVSANLPPSIQGKTISVTGFDYNANFVSDKKKDGSKADYGRKLIIEFNVTVRKGFLGGNNVPTNEAASGLYENGSETTPLETFEQPTVDVAIGDVTVSAAEKNTYLTQVPTDAQLMEGATIRCGETDITNPNALADWQKAFVNIETPSLTKSEGFDATADGTYTITAKVSPKKQGTVTAKSGTSGAQNINVFKPELTFEDSEAYYGAEVPDLKGNLTMTEWKHNGTVDTEATMTGEKPELTITCTPDADKVKDKKINTKQDVGVDVTVTLNNTNVTDKTTFQHTNCTGQTCTLPEGKKFLIHIKTCKLTITKKGGKEDESYVFDIYKDGEKKYSEVTIWGNGTATLYELPVGTYTIKENTGWSWRFIPTYSEKNVELSANANTGTITCTNTKDNDKWINGFSDVKNNIFKKVATN